MIKLKNKKLFATFFLATNSLLFFPILTNAQVCVSASGVVVKGVTESECNGRGGNNWSNKPATEMVTCIKGGALIQKSAAECEALRGTVKTDVTSNPAIQNLEATTKQTYYIPGVTKNTSIPEYVKLVYSYAIGVVGIIATIVIMVGGLIWITSMGNAARVTDAKDWIGAALSGLALAMFSYTILFIINPDLVNFKFNAPKMVEKSADADVGTVAVSCCFKQQGQDNPAICTENIKSENCDGTYSAKPCTNISACRGNTTFTGDTCKKYNTQTIIDFSTSPAIKSTSCDKFDTQFQSAATSNIDYKLIKAIATQESKCNSSAVSKKGACGIMQLKPDTASALAGKTITCDDLKKDDVLSIKLGTKYLDDNKNKYGLTADDTIAGYNGGYGTKPNADGTKPPLAKSLDCDGAKAYQCCTKPGGLAETQDYVTKVDGYYKGYQ